MKTDRSGRTLEDYRQLYWDERDRRRALQAKLDAVRKEFVFFWSAQGCDCCADLDEIDHRGRQLAALLNIPIFDDDSGVDYWTVCEAYEQEQEDE